MAFIDRIGEIASKVVAKTLSDPEKSGELLRLGLTAATLPDREDTSQSAFDLGRFRQYNISRQQEDQAKAAALEAQRKAAEEQRKRIFEIEKEDRKFKFEADMKVAEHIAERQKENRDAGRAFRSEWETFSGNTGTRHWSQYANNIKRDDGTTVYVPNEGTQKLFEFNNMFGQGSKDADVRKRGLIAFDKFIRVADQSYRINEKKLLKDANARASQRDQVMLHGSMQKVAAQLGFDTTDYLVSKDSFSNKPVVDSKTGRPIRSGNDNKIDAHYSKMANNFSSFFSQFFAKYSSEAERLGFTRQEFANVTQSFSNIRKNILTPGEAGKRSDDLDVASDAAVFLATKLGEKESLRKVLIRAKSPTTVHGPNGLNDARTSSTDGKGTIQDLDFFLRNPLLAQIALKVGAITNEDMKQIEKERTKAGGRGYVYRGESADGITSTTVYAYKPQPASILGQAIENQKRNTKALLENATPEQKQEHAAIEKEMSERYTLGDEERQDLFFRKLDLENQIRGTSRRKNEYKEAAIYIASNSATHIITRSGLASSTIPLESGGIAMRDTDGKPTRFYVAMENNQKNVNELLKMLKRIRRLALVSEKDFETFGGSDVFSKVSPLMGTAGEVSGRFESALKFVQELTRVIRGGAEQYTGGKLLSSIKEGSLYEQFENNSEEFQKLYGYKVSLNPDNDARIKNLENKTRKGFNIAETDFKEAMEKAEGDVTKQKIAKSIYLRRTALMWEKAALTYKLAGYVQGEQTGGRTISNQDFDNIYKALWGGNFSSEESAINAVRYLNFTTQEIKDRAFGNMFLLETIGKGFNLGSVPNLYAEEIYNRRLDKFFGDNPDLKQFVKNAGIDLEKTENRAQSQGVQNIILMAKEQDKELGSIPELTAVGLDETGIRNLNKTAVNLSRGLNNSRKISRSKDFDSYRAFEDIYNAIHNRSGDLSGTLSTLTDNFTILEEIVETNDNRAAKAAMSLALLKEVPYFEKMNTIAQNIATISVLLQNAADSGMNIDYNTLEEQFGNNVSTQNSVILKFFRDDPDFLTYIFDTYHKAS